MKLITRIYATVNVLRRHRFWVSYRDIHSRSGFLRTASGYSTQRSTNSSQGKEGSNAGKAVGTSGDSPQIRAGLGIRILTSKLRDHFLNLPWRGRQARPTPVKCGSLLNVIVTCGTVVPSNFSPLLCLPLAEGVGAFSVGPDFFGIALKTNQTPRDSETVLIRYSINILKVFRGSLGMRTLALWLRCFFHPSLRSEFRLDLASDKKRVCKLTRKRLTN